MNSIGTGEAAVALTIAILQFGIPIAFAAWVAITLVRIRRLLEEIAGRTT